ncbi:MAG: TIGR04282 family arsenosugar biosynthesis glycosyltransferase [Smithella sp.]
MNQDALILFLRYPERGAVKTRLADTLGAELTYELYQRFLADLSVMVREVQTAKVIVYEGQQEAVFPDFPGIGPIRQRGSDMGDRMFCALSDVFALGFERCVLIGSDSPDLPARLVNDAFDKLTSADVVIGPSRDGGYYLIGCNQASLHRTMFSGIPWSTADVLPETLQRIAQTGLVSARLEQWSDIDEIKDLRQFYERNRKRTTRSQTMKFLNETGMSHER